MWDEWLEWRRKNSWCKREEETAEPWSLDECTAHSSHSMNTNAQREWVRAQQTRGTFSSDSLELQAEATADAAAALTDRWFSYEQATKNSKIWM